VTILLRSFLCVVPGVTEHLAAFPAVGGASEVLTLPVAARKIINFGFPPCSPEKRNTYTFTRSIASNLSTSNPFIDHVERLRALETPGINTLFLLSFSNPRYQLGFRLLSSLSPQRHISLRSANDLNSIPNTTIGQTLAASLKRPEGILEAQPDVYT
jgi:hypothetical protein